MSRRDGPDPGTIAAPRRRALDAVLYGASAAGEHSICWMVLIGARAAGGPIHRNVAARAAVGLVAEELIVNEVLKPLFGRARPPVRGEHPHWFRQPTDASFPSGHAAAASCSSILLSDRHPALAPAYYALAATIAVSRWYCGAHHASDVAGGIVVGAAIGILVRRAFPV